MFRLLAARGCAYAIKVGYWSWLPLKPLAAERQRWLPVAPNVTGFFHDLYIPQWNLHLRVMIYRKHVGHESPKNFQLDLFTPDDGHFEYAAVATNLALDLPALYAFICGRSPWTSSPRATTGPTVPGSNSVSSRTTSSAASSSTPSPCPNPARANAPIRT